GVRRAVPDARATREDRRARRRVGARRPDRAGVPAARGSTGVAARGSLRLSGAAPAPGRILIADDNRVNRLLLARGLEQQGHTIVFAEHGREALELLRKQPFDLLLLALSLPELD